MVCSVVVYPPLVTPPSGGVCWVWCVWCFVGLWFGFVFGVFGVLWFGFVFWVCVLGGMVCSVVVCPPLVTPPPGVVVVWEI